MRDAAKWKDLLPCFIRQLASSDQCSRSSRLSLPAARRLAEKDPAIRQARPRPGARDRERARLLHPRQRRLSDFATLPINAILSARREAGIPGYVSNTADTYVGNLTFYTSSHLSRRYGHRTCRIHVPCLPEQAVEAEDDTPSVSLDLMVRAAEPALEVSVERSEDVAFSGGAVS